MANSGSDLNHIEGFSKDGDYVQTVHLTGPDGMKAAVLTLGARLLDLRMADGHPLSLSFHSLDDVQADTAFIGSLVGRVANRIRDAEFSIDGKKTTLEKNLEGKHHIHGGHKSWDKKLFTVAEVSQSAVDFFLYSPDKDQGYPSAVEVRIRYELKGDGELFISLQTKNVGAEPTVTNMTAHPYFDLTGTWGGTEDAVLDYTVHAPLGSQYLELDDEQLPTGKIESVENTRYDFREPATIGSKSTDNYDQYLVCEGANSDEDHSTREVLRISTAPLSSGQTISMQVLTNQPGFQFYTPTGFGEGQPFKKFGSFAVEPSGFIDAPSNANFPSVTLNPSEEREQLISYKFTATQG